MLKKTVHSKRTKSIAPTMKAVSMHHDETKRLTAFLTILKKIDQQEKRAVQSEKSKDKKGKLNYDKKARLTAGPLLLWVLDTILSRAALTSRYIARSVRIIHLEAPKKHARYRSFAFE